ncbi:NUDIX hydrolase [Amaricoccus macauensis]|uniref:NUDIX hydrolase n=1 Tax=Amaricoccus macauensis TaxID=57001 RepID=UPI001C84C82C|nr:NUDIX hydrolase [Amaricoccus macauensis]
MKPIPTRSTAVTAPGQPPRLQVGALCWRRSRKGLRILLITSRDTGRWVIPKGWPMRNRTEAGAAAREAWEEAGLRGQISAVSIGVYTYRKRTPHSVFLPCVVRVYPLEAREMLQKFPEIGQRRARWFSPEKAARRVAEHELAALIRAFDPDAWATASPGPAPNHPADQSQDAAQEESEND